MARLEVKELYFDWIYRNMCGIQNRNVSYKKLLSYLFNANFDYILPMDANRLEDGIDLRYRFGRDTGVPDYVIAAMDDTQCSILEMMVALAFRCEEHIMNDPDMGDRVAQWFWNMIMSLGLSSMTDKNYDQRLVDSVLYRFINREYEPSGKGGLFTIESGKYDMRNVDIWYQMMFYLNEEVEKG